MRSFVWLWLGILVSCGGPDPMLEIDQFHLRDASVKIPRTQFEEQVAYADHQKRLHGAVTAKERKDRLGDYYTVRWRGPEELQEEPIRLVFHYRQGATGRAAKTKELVFPAAEKGVCEFNIIGEEYQQGGRVLAWRVDYFRGSALVATKRSYLWE